MEKIILYYLIRIKEEKTNEGKKLMLRDLFFKSMIEGYPEGFAKEHFYNVLKETPKIVCWNKNKTRYKIQSHLILDLNEDIWLELIQNSIENKIQQSKEACIRALSTFENERTKRKACFVLESLLEDSGAKTQMNIAFELGKLGSHDKAIQILKKLKENPELDPHKDELGRKVNYKLNIEYILEDLYEKSKKYSELDIKQLRKICKKRKIDYVSKTKTRTKEEIIAMLENEE